MIMIEDELPEKEEDLTEIKESEQTPEEDGVESASNVFDQFLKESE